MTSNNARVEGTLTALRAEWKETQTRLKQIEDAIRAVSVLLDSPSPLFGESSILIAPSRPLIDLASPGLDLLSPSDDVADVMLGRVVSRGGQRAVFPDTPGSAAAGRSVASVPEDPPPPVSRRRPPLRASILRLLQDQPITWTLGGLVEAMRERDLVGGTSEKTIKETIRQTANKMAAEGEIRRRGSTYGWPPGWDSDVAGKMAPFLEDLIERGDALPAQPVGERQDS